MIRALPVSTLVLLLSGCAPRSQAPVPPARPLVDASFTAEEGKTIRLSDYRETREVVLLFMRGFTGDFACFHCGTQTRAYKKAYAQFQAAGAEVLVILPGTVDARGYLRRVGRSDPQGEDPDFAVPFPVAGDPLFEACTAFGVPFDPLAVDTFPVSQPATIVVGRDGRIRYEHHGEDPSDRPAAETVLESLRGGGDRAPAARGTPVTPGTSLSWQPYEAGLARARAEGKPILLEFYADW